MAETRYAHPWIRFLACLAGVTVTFVTHSLPLLLAGIGGVAVMSVIGGVGQPFLRFSVYIVAPVAAALWVVWALIVGAPPGMPIGAAPDAGRDYALVVALRLMMVGGLLQMALLTIGADDLPATMYAVGLRESAVVLAMATFAVFPELKMRADQIVTARYARGLAGRRRWISGIQQLPYIFRPLLVWMLRSAIQRAEAWQQRGLSFRRSALRCSWPRSAALVVLSTGWAALAWTVQ